jgi:Phycobilisome degradation protein nblA
MEELGAALNLTLEQEFRLRRYTEEVKGLSEKDARNYLLDLMHQVMIKDNVIKQLLKKAL